MTVFFSSKPVNPVILLHDGDQIAGLVCIHTPGSICLYDPESEVLFTGDTLTTRKGVISISPSAPTHDLMEARESVKRIDLLDVNVFLSGHGVPVTGQVAEKIREYSQR
ncbi:MBL fold metallo-hydrolase [Methanosphaerula palustris]|uniref:MBL fold metallo-hydrolase n=1 Tax=Methanosphaerula palustris TaxID=475088 RepID=UPI00373AE1D1